MKKIHYFAMLAACAMPASAATTFSFQQGDLRQDGVLFGVGSGYAGASDGSIIDQNPTKTANSGTANRIGTQFNSTSANTGNDGRGINGLFTFDLTALADYLAANPTFTVSDVSLSVTRVGGGGSFGRAISLYATEAYTDSANWTTSDGTNPWSSPTTPNGTTTPGLAGGGTVGALVGGTTFGTTKTTAPWVWGTSANFTAAVNSALAGDKKLYLLAQTGYGNGDSFFDFAKFDDATVENRPDLQITVIPEPSAALLGALGALFLLRRRR
ncbi:hypothetical protein HZ994_16680 [Akkermansiaceae bacterium]|nr:hypothetical protein HZ994_16680 [Akkermansiaceae bacterium]